MRTNKDNQLTLTGDYYELRLDADKGKLRIEINAEDSVVRLTSKEIKQMQDFLTRNASELTALVCEVCGEEIDTDSDDYLETSSGHRHRYEGETGFKACMKAAVNTLRRIRN